MEERRIQRSVRRVSIPLAAVLLAIAASVGMLAGASGPSMVRETPLAKGGADIASPAAEAGLVSGEFYVSPVSGERYRIMKDLDAGTVSYCGASSPTCYLSVDELLGGEALGLPSWAVLVEPALRARVLSGTREPVNVVVELRGGTFSSIASSVWQSRLEGIRHATIARTPAALDAYVDAARRDVYNLGEASAAPAVEALRARLTDIGTEYQGYTPVLPAVFARIPLSSIPALASGPEVLRISENRKMSAALDVSAYAIFADTWWGNGLTGGPWDLGIIDTGIDASHPALTVDFARVFHSVAQGDPCYQDSPMNPDDFHGHGTHIAGTAASVDATYRGVAYGLGALINGKAGFLCNGSSWMYWSDGMQAIDWAIVAAGADVISFSFGGSPGSGDTPMGRFFDAVVDSLGVPTAVAAHNYGPGSGTVTEPGSAYNVITVANMNDANTIPRADDAINPSSGRGPTADGRLKPDIAAPGTLIASTNAFWETQPDFVSWTGTSMATPHVAAALVLLTDGIGSVFAPMRKALLLNSADDWGTAGPDTTYGHGYLNLRRAWDNRSSLYDGTIPPGALGLRFYAGLGTAGDRATLAWNRHSIYQGPTYPGFYYPINDLDLYVYDGTTNTGLTFSNTFVDNAEAVSLPADYPQVIYKVRSFGSFSGVAEEHYAIAVPPGVVPATGPALAVSISPPPTARLGSVFPVSATVTNSGGLNAHFNDVGLTIPSGLTLVSGANPQRVVRIGPGEAGTVSWQLRGDAMGLWNVSAAVGSQSYGELITATSGNSTVDVVEATPPVSSVDPLPAYEVSALFAVTATASDPGSGVAQVELWYRKDGGAWAAHGIDASFPWAWAFNASARGGDGLYEFYSVATDNTSNVETKAPGPEASSTVDTADPVTTLAFAGTRGNGGWFTSIVTASLSANDTGSGVSSMSYRIDGSVWTLYTSPLAVGSDGTHTVDYYSSDRAGNAESPRSLDLWIDRTAPATTAGVTGTPGASGWFVSEVLITLSATDSTSGVVATRYRLDGGTWQTYSAPIAVSEGVHVLDYASEDAAGLVEATRSTPVNVDLTRPSIAVSASGIQGGGGWRRSPVVVTATGSDATSGVASVRYRVNQSPWTDYTAPFTLTSEGLSAIEFEVLDNAGNSASATAEYRVDTRPPATTITSPANGSIVGESSTVLTWSESEDGSGLEGCTLALDGGVEIPAPGVGSYTFAELSDGTHSIMVRCKDVAGNEGRSSATFTVQTPKPLAWLPYVFAAVIVVVAIVAVFLVLLRRTRKDDEGKRRPEPP